MLGETQGKHLKKYVSDYVLFDLETTGISCACDEVIEISALKVRNGLVTAEFSSLVNPGRKIPAAASAVNNITNAMVADKPCFAEVLSDFLEFIGDDVLVGHNIAGFDMKFLYRDCDKYFGRTLTNDYVDTLYLAKRCFPEWKHRRLSDLAEYYGLSTEGAHRALADCRMNQAIFENLGQRLRKPPKTEEMLRKAEFLKRYCSTMNPQQLEAVQTTEGPVLLLAVPGSGKTFVLVARVGFLILTKKVKPENILTLTYTVAAARDMEERFNAVFGDCPTEGVEFRTINGICAKVIAYYGTLIGRTPYELLTDEKELAGITADIYVREVQEYPTENDIKTVRSLITYCKNRMLTEAEVEKLGGENRLPLKEILAAYNGELKKRRVIDYDDQLVYAYRILSKEPGVLQHYRQLYRYICVDEAQDTSRIQHAIISLLAGPTGNLFMVGDEDQSIYGFRAAYPEALVQFETDHPGAKVLLMETNYRSNAKIVEKAAAFIQNNKFRYEKHMTAFREPGEDITCVSVAEPDLQYSYLMKMALDCRERTAVLYRDHESAIPLIDLLERRGIPYRLRSGDYGFFTHRVVTDIINILQFSRHPEDTGLFLQIYYKLKLYLKKAQALELCDAAAGRGIPVLHGAESVDSLSDTIFRNCRNMRIELQRLTQDTPAAALNRILEDMGYREYLEKNDLGESKLRILKALAARERTVEAFLDRLTYLRTRISEGEFDRKAYLTLSTIHSSKGLEYDTVYLIDVIDGLFPAKNPGDYRIADREDIRNYEEERRLFYVAVTRAKNRLVLFKYGGQNSEFLKEIGVRYSAHRVSVRKGK